MNVPWWFPFGHVEEIAPRELQDKLLNDGADLQLIDVRSTVEYAEGHVAKTRNYRVPNVDAEKCRACRKCLARNVCRLKALVQFESSELPYVNQELCRGYLVCVEECPFGAIQVE